MPLIALAAQQSCEYWILRHPSLEVFDWVGQSATGALPRRSGEQTLGGTRVDENLLDRSRWTLLVVDEGQANDVDQAIVSSDLRQQSNVCFVAKPEEEDRATRFCEDIGHRDLFSVRPDSYVGFARGKADRNATAPYVQRWLGADAAGSPT